ncbi:TIGR03089 family protein [Actinocorallia sp. A-T 12471]|uniref:TIGR03089 family protein n=1 Tax=Actinocorallia sp. A-T 12471 TaxID=3089813 RepID=UPI0029D30BA7|nr:TIGR03089 family protein [Actinocorallia sp. A-T 12471]MDX6744632.1 TIGR03089 family protein [Actinocorallia sp. A-T 12471]
MDLLRGSAQRPLVTFYDDSTGERLEFSRRTFDNWTAKTANLLVDGLGAQPGGRVVIDLPLHWQTAVWIFAAWWAGQEVVLGRDAVVEEEGLWVTADPASAPDWPDEVVGLSLDAMGAPLKDAPAWVTDYAVEVRAYGDRFSPYVHSGPKLTVTNTTFDTSQLDTEIASFLQKHRLHADDRVLVAAPFTDARSLISGLLAPLRAEGSVILCRDLADDLVPRRIETEHVTAVAGLETPYATVRRLP